MARRRFASVLIKAGLTGSLLSGCAGSGPDVITGSTIPDAFLARRTSVLPETATPEPTPPPRPPEPIVEPPIPQIQMKPVEPAPEPAPIPVSAPVVAPAPTSAATPEPPAILALRGHLGGDEKAVREALQDLDETDRKALSILLPVVASIGQGELAKELPTVLQQLELLADSLRVRAPLTLGKVCFCRGIEGYGVYDPVATSADGIPVFLSGADGRPGERVQVYVELRNFTTRKVGAYYETRLAGTLEIISEVAGQRVSAGQAAVRINRPAQADQSLSPRQDYFLNFQFNIPPRLPPGVYTLRVKVRDELAPQGKPQADADAGPEPKFRVEAPN
jgi:hypothetical protein